LQGALYEPVVGGGVNVLPVVAGAAAGKLGVDGLADRRISAAHVVAPRQGDARDPPDSGRGLPGVLRGRGGRCPKRPRVHSSKGQEIPPLSGEELAAEDPFNTRAGEQMMIGMATRDQMVCSGSPWVILLPCS
jgi:hypothetical protein